MIKELGYVVLDATDIAAWWRFAEEMLGAMVLAPGEGVLSVRLDERNCRLLVRKAEQDRLVAIGWLLKGPGEWQAAQAQLVAKGADIQSGSVEECVARGVSAFFWLIDPAGHRHEMAWGPVVNFRDPFRSPVGVSSFHTGEQGMGHIVVGCEPDQYDVTAAFIQDVLGFEVANIRKTPLAGVQIPFPVTWYRCDNSRQHSLALAPIFTPGMPRHGCRHINLEVASIDDVGMAYDRANALGVPIARSLGRHVNDRAISFYVVSPSGFHIEYGCDSPRRQWSEEIVYDEGGIGSLWGHQPVPRR